VVLDDFQWIWGWGERFSGQVWFYDMEGQIQFQKAQGDTIED